MKIQYAIPNVIVEESCDNCSQYCCCQYSLHIGDIKHKFGVTKCRDYVYSPPLKIFECNDEEFCDKVVKLILEQQEKELQ